MNKNKKTSVKPRKNKETYPHFRHYKKSGHPALILSPNSDDKYNFRRVTSSEFSGHHRNEKIEPNPDSRRDTPMYVVKQRQTDLRKNFSSWRYSWKYPKK